MSFKPSTVNIEFTRGDTFPFVLEITDGSNNPIDITGYAFLLTVDPSETPSDALNNLFQLTGSTIDATNGKVQFALTGVQADQTPGVYYYDLQQTDPSSSIRTIAKGTWTFIQDITK